MRRCAKGVDSNHAPGSSPPPVPRLSRGFVVVLIGLALLAGSIALYLPSVGFGFVGYDDVGVLLEHRNLYGQDSLGRSLHEIFVGYFPREEPLLVRDVSWLLDARMFGFTNPVGYHLGNVLLNAANVVLLFLFLLHATRRLGLAALTAALFATLAVHVEPVCWIMGRKDLLSAFFVLLALLAQAAVLHQERRSRRWLLRGAVFLLYPLAVLSKFSAIVLVAVLAAYKILAPHMNGRRAPGQSFARSEWPRGLLGLLPHAAVGAGILFWYRRVLTAYQIVGDFGPPAFSAAHLENLAALVPLSLRDSLFRVFSAAGHSISYLRPNVSISVAAVDLALAYAVVIGGLALIVGLLRFRKDLAFFPIAFGLFLLPYLNFEYIGIWAADRYSYLASACVVALLAAPLVEGLSAARPSVRRAAVAGLAAVSLLGAYQIIAGLGHQPAFRDAEALWTYEKQLPRPSVLAYRSYAAVLLHKAEVAAPDSAERRQMLEAAVAAAKEGIHYYRTIPWQPAPAYVGRERIHLASMLTVMAQAARLAGAPLEQQLELYRTAFNVAPADEQTEDLAAVLFEVANRNPRNLELARESLRHFRDHARYARRDPLQIERLRSRLRAYTESFPELAAEVAAVAGECLR
jgi:hypothetical protein